MASEAFTNGILHPKREDIVAITYSLNKGKSLKLTPSFLSPCTAYEFCSLELNLPCTIKTTIPMGFTSK